MCRKPSKSKRSKIRAAEERISSLWQSTPKSAATETRWRQTTLVEVIDDETYVEIPIEASGEPQGCIRIALQNTNGIRLRGSGNILPEAAAISRLDLDIVAWPESKLSSNGQTKEVLQGQLNSMVGSSYVIEAAAPKIRDGDGEYQPGGVMLTITGKTTGRMSSSYRDPMGRFVTTSYRGVEERESYL